MTTMQINKMVFDIFLSTWYIWVIIIVLSILSALKPLIKGKIGEKAVALILSRLNKDKYKIINDVMLEIYGTTTQIDHIVVSNYGIFVIETKNYKGWIYGEECSQYWTQVIYKRKEKLYNPIRQNYGHVQYLKDKLIEFDNINFIPIIVFSINADLNVKTTTHVIYTTKLLRTIKKYNAETISNENKEEIYAKILSLNVNSKEMRKKHVAAIRQNKRNIYEKINNDICPRCGGRLVMRKGKYGTFKGCSNYPRCSFTKKG